MRRSEFARRLGIHPDSVLNLERRGFIHPARDWANHRRYTERDLYVARCLIFQQADVANADVGGGHPPVAARTM